MKKIFFLFIILSSTSILSQFKITDYFDAEIGLTYKFSDRLQTELRVNDNLSFRIGISTFPFHSNNIAFFENYFLPLQIEIIPFRKAINFGLVLEGAYHFSDIVNSSGIRSSIEIRYLFNYIKCQQT